MIIAAKTVPLYTVPLYKVQVHVYQQKLGCRYMLPLALMGVLIKL